MARPLVEGRAAFGSSDMAGALELFALRLRNACAVASRMRASRFAKLRRSFGVRAAYAQNSMKTRNCPGSRAVASSSLVKTAVHGADPNWGRIVCALGYSGSEVAIDRLTVSVAGVTVFTAGAGVEVDLEAVRRAFEQPEIEIRAELGLGPGAADAFGCDLSAEYVRINADYTT